MGRRVTCREPDGLPSLLRQDAVADRPRFSEALHCRILRRLPAVPTAIRLAEPRTERAGRSEWRQAVHVAAAAALLVSLAIVGDAPDPADGRLPTAARVATAPAGGGEVTSAGDAATLGIDRVPMFDDLDAGVREGVSTLAATLLDVPEWRMLADFDAAGFLGAEAAP